MAKYLMCGNIMSDTVEDANGVRGEFHMGGPAIFGLEGVKLWTDDCAMLTNAGHDWEDSYGKWLDENGIDKSTVVVHPETDTNKCMIKHNPDGTYKWVPLQGREHINYLLVKPEQIENAIGEDTEAIYLFMNPYEDFFSKFEGVLNRKNVKFMWEYGVSPMGGEYTFDLVHLADMLSINISEARQVLGIEDEEKIIEELQKLPVEFVFFRVGKRGAYGITKDEVWFCPSIDPYGPSVDPSGCGNCSTAAAMYGWCEGLGAAKATAIGCISSGFNAAQYGVWDKFTGETRKKAEELLEYTVNNSLVRVK